MFCQKCGSQMPDGTSVCSNCGNNLYQQSPSVEDKPSAGFNVLSFFFPLIGLILYLVWNKETPLKAKACGKWALIGFITGIVFSILYSVVIVGLMGSMMNSYY